MRSLMNQVLYFISLLILVGGEIRAPPNMNPQHYQQYQQVPVQQQVHVPVQQVPVQQMPVQQMPVQQIPVQQMPMQQGTVQQQVPMQQGTVQQQVPMHQSAHVHGHADPKLLNTANIDQEKAHIQEHMAVPLDTSKMTEQELQFHYFKMHDADNNNKLDGCELIKSLIHWHEQGGRDHGGQQTPPQDKIFSDEELMQLIDPILQMDDMNGDGYIDYPEFVRAQQKAAAAQAQVQRHG